MMVLYQQIKNKLRNNMLIQRFIIGLILGSTVLGSIATTADYDLALTGRRVIDPETGLDEIRDLAIKDGHIAAISANALTDNSEIGANSSITVFSPDKINDRATYENPYQTSVGINQIIMNGEIVVRNGVLIEGVHLAKVFFSTKK